jgi:hypothetical protein
MIGRSIVEGFKFALSLRRMLPYIFLNLLLLFAVGDMFGRVGSLITVSPDVLQSVAPYFVFYLLVFVLYFFSMPLLLGATIYQAKNFRKKKLVKQSFRFSLSIYFKTFVILIIMYILHGIAGFVPYIFPLVMLFFYLAFFYVLPAAIADNKKILESFKRSFAIFKKYPLQTFVVFILVSFVSIVLFITSVVPISLWLVGNMLSFGPKGMTDRVLLIAQLLLSPVMFVLELVPAVLISFNMVMCIGVTTRLYLNLKKRRA